MAYYTEQEALNIGQNLKRIRALKGLSVQDLAKMVLVNQATIYRIETGHAPKPSVLGRIARALKVEIKDLIK